MTETKQTLSGQLRQRTTALNASEVAALLRISREAVYRYARQRMLPSLRFGDFLRFDPSELADWLDAGQQMAQSLRTAGPHLQSKEQHHDTRRENSEVRG